MNDILLTFDEMLNVRDEALAEWVRQLDAHEPEWEMRHSSEEYLWPAICRAQVRKVVGDIAPDLNFLVELFKAIQGRQERSEWECTEGIATIKRLVAALKAAGEGK